MAQVYDDEVSCELTRSTVHGDEAVHISTAAKWGAQRAERSSRVSFADIWLAGAFAGLPWYFVSSWSRNSERREGCEDNGWSHCKNTEEKRWMG